VSDDLQEKLADFDAELTLNRARTIPGAWYTDPEIYAAECRRVFHDTWQVAGRVDQVAEPGSFFTAELAGEPIVVVRDESGTLRAFYNVCRHRAAQVAPEPAGKTTRFRCRYHGWTYDLAGRLRGTPEFEGVADFDRAQNGLVPVSVDTWGPLVWVHLGGPHETLADFLSPLPERTAGRGVETLHFVERRDYTLRCNWKVFVDNYLDGGYHVNTVHPGLADVLDYSRYRTETAAHTSVQISPIRGSSPGGAAGVGAVRGGDAAYYWWVFPNFMLNLYEGIMDTNLVLPLGVDSCRVIFDFYFAKTGSQAAQPFMEQSISVAHQIQQEDVDICEEVQRGLASRAYGAGRFSVKREEGVYHFQRLLAQRLRGTR
jgi:choline monooxygenase